VIKLHEADAALDQPPREQTIARERRLVLFHTVEPERLLAFAGEINQLWRAGLHSVSHLVSSDAGGDFRVTGFDEAFEIQIADGVN